MGKKDNDGISPILAILLMIAITLMIAGIVVIWVFSFLEDEHDPNDLFTFDVDLDSSLDTVKITMMKGSITDSSRVKIFIDGTNTTLESGPIHAGVEKDATTSIDLVRGQTYNIKIVVDKNLIFDQDRTAL